ncbi:UNVERIFIED_CONTAM: hypothetical protein GTU68_028250 [Idotea baltica]|nr:hypothetical protein [Idotea baltica]
MPNDFPRSHRVADFIQRELSELIRTEIKDPRVSAMVTVSSVEVSRDLGTAKVHYTIMGAEPGERAETEKALKNAAGFLRRKLAPRLNTRSVPQLRFYYDDSIERGAHMSALIDDAVATNTTVDENALDETAPNDSAADGISSDNTASDSTALNNTASDNEELNGPA